MRKQTGFWRITARLPLGGAALLLLLTSACFQPTGAALEATQAAQIAQLPTNVPAVTAEATELLLPFDDTTPTVTQTPTDVVTLLPTDGPTITPSPTATLTSTDVPTLTPSPTETPTQPGFPTLTFTASPTTALGPSATPTPSHTVNPFVTIDPTRYLTLTPVQVAMLPNQQLDPILQTATQLAVQAGIGAQPIAPTTDPNVFSGVTDPLLLTATAVIAGATQTAAFPLTQTQQAILGPSPTAGVIVPPTSAIVTPQPTLFVTATPSGPVISGTDCIHEVQATDRNLFRISLSYGLTVNQIATASGIVNPALIYVGQRLVIPGCGTTGFRPPPTSQPTAGFPVTTPNPGTNVCGPVYVVQQGDTLFEISLSCGVPVMTIAQLNGITNINLIFINQELRLQ